MLGKDIDPKIKGVYYQVHINLKKAYGYQFSIKITM